MSPQNQSIGLTDLINQVKQELLATALNSDDSVPFLYVDSIELELQVAVSKTGEGGVKIDVLSVGGAELGGTVAQEKVQTVKVSLSSLFDREQLLDYYKATQSDDVMTSLHRNMKAVMKGVDQGSADDAVV